MRGCGGANGRGTGSCVHTERRETAAGTGGRRGELRELRRKLEQRGVWKGARAGSQTVCNGCARWSDCAAGGSVRVRARREELRR